MIYQNSNNMTRIFIKDQQSRITRYTTNFIDVTDFAIGIQATAPAKKIGNNIIVADNWIDVKTKDGATLPGVYKIVKEYTHGKITYITAKKATA